jgi:zinc protease
MNSIALPEIETQVLDNGLKVLAVRIENLPLVSIVLMLNTGAETDGDGKAGQADLTCEMLTLGTEKRSSDEIALEIDSLGARLIFYSGWDATFIEIEGLSEDLPVLLEILSDMVLRPTFPKPEFDQLKGRRIARLIQDQDDSGIVADEQFVQLVFGGTPYGHLRRGTVDSVRALSLGDLKAFHARHFLADRCSLMIVGKIDFEDAFGGAAKFLDPLGRGPGSADVLDFALPEKVTRKVRIIHRPDLTQSQIRLGHPGIRRTSPDHDVFQVANYILGGGGFSSRLMERIRSQKGYTYGISSQFKGRRHPGPFVISTFTPNQSTFAVVTEVIGVVEAFIEGGTTSKELKEAKNYYLGSYPFRFETYRKIAREILEVELYGLGIRSLAEYPQRVSKITQREIQSVVPRNLNPDSLFVVIVGNCEFFKKEMEKLGPVEIIDFQTLVARR